MMSRYKILFVTVLLSLQAAAQVNKIHYDTATSDYHIEELKEEDPNEKGHFYTPPEMIQRMGMLRNSSSPSNPFEPCGCDVVKNLEALYPDDEGSNIGFEEEKDRGLSNWVFFVGSNRNYLASFNDHAYFECDKYYTGSMSPEQPGPWGASQLTDLEKKTTLMKQSDGFKDDVGGFPVTPPMPGVDIGMEQHALRLNMPEMFPRLENYADPAFGSTNPAVMAVRKVKIKRCEPFLTYKYALALSNFFQHGPFEGAYFRVQVFKYEQDEEENFICDGEKCCESLLIKAPSEKATVPGIEINEYRSTTWGKGGRMAGMGNAKYKDWTNRIIDFEEYMSSEETEATFVIAFTASYCKGNHDFGYAYIDLEPGATGISYTGGTCEGSELSFRGPSGNSYRQLIGDREEEELIWSVTKGGVPVSLDGVETNTHDFKYTFEEHGTYEVTVNVISENVSASCLPCSNRDIPCNSSETYECTKTYTREIEIKQCPTMNRLKCADCINSFAPIPGQKYVLSAWAKQKSSTPEVVTTYTKPEIIVSYNTPIVAFERCTTQGPIIDGWQKIEHVLTIPEDAEDIHITLNGSATSGYDVFYDDIRFFPFYGNMKSFVYDPDTQKLMAELDENNYSTYYEYDEEGKLKRIKKETERGVMTVKEAGNNSSNK